MASTLARLDNGRFQRLARIFSRDHGVRVLLRGLAPATIKDERGDVTILLPVNSDELGDAEQQVLEGVLDHEVSHVREEREAEARQARGEKCLTPLEQGFACRDKTEKMLWNCYEDVRIENAARKQWPGMADNLATTARHYVEVQRKSMQEGKPVNSWGIVGGIIAFGARGDYLGWVPKEAQPLIDLLQPEIEAAKRTETTEDCYRLAVVTIEKLRDKDLHEEPEPEPQPDNSGQPDPHGDPGQGDATTTQADGGSGGQRKPGDGAGRNSPPPDGPGDTPPPQAGGQEGSDQEGGGSGGDRTDGGNRQGGGPGEGDDASGDAGGPPPSADGDGDGQGDADGEAERRRSFMGGLQGGADTDDLANYVREIVKDMAAQDVAEHPQRWLPDPAAVDLDRWVASPSGTALEYQEISARVRPQVAVMRARLRVQLQTDAEDRVEGDRESGAVDPAALYSLRLGNRRVFSERVPGHEMDTVVSMLIDQSGSMAYRQKYRCAGEAAVALSETLDSFGIPFEVVGFQNCETGQVPYCPPYTRHAPFEYALFKAFAERYRSVRERLCSVGAGDYNIDGEAVITVARRLAAQPQQRKIMIVLSDGLPYGGDPELAPVVVWHLGEVIRSVSRAGIEVYGVGINSDCVEEFYNRENGSAHVVVDDVDDLASQVVRLLSGSLMRRAA